MHALLWLIPALPLAGFLVILLFGRTLGRTGTAAVGVGSIFLAAVVATIVGVAYMVSPPAGGAYHQVLWTWFSVAGLKPQIAFYLDSLSLVMTLIVTWVGFLIHLYSVGYMAHDEARRRFFLYMNLFVFSMLVLVLGENLLFFFLGWEGVGLCSYLLIGFWYREPYNGYAARKAFVVTRVGDTALLVGLLLLFTKVGTLSIQPILQQAQAHWARGSTLAVWVALLLLGGAVGKSAQLPLQTWLPDAMAGPTPVSALIHAATMVTAGVYLIARMHTVFTLAPGVRLLVAIVGAATLLYAGFSALVQTDIKRVLAYSTISQIGYMFLALGVSAWTAALFHFMTHAFFKALLFLSAGLVIEALGGEQDMRKMGGLRHDLPLAFWSFLIGAASLSALPLVTAGFYSKEIILEYTLRSTDGSLWLWLAGAAGAALTALYSFRAVMLVFYGSRVTAPRERPGLVMNAPVAVLSVLAVIGGLLWWPLGYGVHIDTFARFMERALPVTPTSSAGFGGSPVSHYVTEIVVLAAVALAWRVWSVRRIPRRTNVLSRFLLAGWGFDWLYDRLFVWPLAAFARWSRSDPFDLFFAAIAWLSRAAHAVLSRTQNGRVRAYAGAVALGAAIIVALAVFVR